MAEPTRTHITVDALDAAMIQLGSGYPVLLLHGWGASADLVVPLAQKLADQGLAVYVPDLPGFGESPEPPVAWTVFDYATWLLHLMDTLGLEQVHLFGHSFGGRISLILGAQHPDRVQRIVLANSAGIRPPVPMVTQARTYAYKGVRSVLESIGLQTLSAQLRQRYNAHYGSSDFNAVSGVMRQTFIQVINQDLQQYAARVQQPTLLFWGDQDNDTPLWMGQTLEKLMPDAALIVHPGAGHYSYLDRLPETAHVMAHFLLN